MLLNASMENLNGFVVFFKHEQKHAVCKLNNVIVTNVMLIVYVGEL